MTDQTTSKQEPVSAWLLDNEHEPISDRVKQAYLGTVMRDHYAKYSTPLYLSPATPAPTVARRGLSNAEFSELGIT